MRAIDAALLLLPILGGGLAACAERVPPPPPPPPAVAPLPSASASASPGSVLALYARACDGESAIGCNNLALAYTEGRSGAKRDLARAASLFQRACDLGAAGGCGNLGILLHTKGPMHDDVRAIGLLTRACDASWWDGCFWLGDIYFGGEHEDAALAYSLFERACKADHVKSCANQGIMLHLGKGVAKDPRHAGSLLERACSAGIFYACTALGNVFLSSEGIPADAKRARASYERGCTDEYPVGCYAYGLRCAAGELGDACDPALLLRRACDLGHADGCTALASWMERQAGGR
jgi:TPR repeat protein